MKFGLAKIADFNVDDAIGILGVSRKSQNDDNNVLIFNQLFKQKKINDKTFSLYKQPDKDIFTLYYDGYHDNFTNEKIEGSRGSCNLVNSNNYFKILWACDVDIIYFGKAKKNLNDDNCIIFQESVIFDTGTNFILLSKKLENSFLSKMKLPKENKIPSDLGEFIYSYDISNIPDVNFIINEKSYLIPKKFLWKKVIIVNETIYIMNIIFHNNFGLNIIGTQFFEIYHTAFNQDKKKLSFYNPNKNYIISVNTFWILNKNLKYFLIVLGILLVILIIVIIFYKIRARKKYVARNPLIQ